jgi:ParB family transcriptional regulator, chromosome partitioning protein
MKKTIDKTLNIKDIKPYWRNPRSNAEAVAKVKESIEKFGYNQYISVDKANVIITGHTRFQALTQLGYQDIKVIEVDLTDQEAKQYRIIDNKVGEIAGWTDDLVIELKEIDDQDLMASFFDEDISALISKSVGQEGAPDITDEDLDKAGGKLDKNFEKLGDEYKDSFKDITCPKCAHEFQIK